MRIKLLPFFILLFWLAGCKNSDNHFTVQGEIANMPKSKVILEELGINGAITWVDSGTSTDKGSFELSGIAPEMGLYRLHFEQNKYILLAIDKGTIKVTGDWNAIENYKVAGSAASENLHQFIIAIDEHIKDVTTMTVVMDSLAVKGNDSVMRVAQKDFTDMRLSFTRFIEQYADTTQYLPNAVFAARILDVRTEKDYLSAFTQGLTRRFPNAKLTKDFEAYYATTTSNMPAPAPASPNVGSMAPDISLTTPDGQVLALSSLKGKYVLLDFWASWCGPCRAENPNVVAAYTKYKDKNFTIYSVSLDEKKESWEDAIKEDGLSWNHVSDLKRWESAAVKLYNIQSIPSNFLIDPTGKIIARDLRGPDLEQKLSEVLH